MEIARKLSLGSINGVRKGFKDVAALMFVGRFFGIANSADVEPTPSGTTQTKFTGEFQAVAMDRKEYAAPVLFLPASAESMLSSAVASAKGKPVRFAFDVYAEPEKASAVGYVLTTRALIDPVAMDTLSDMSATLQPLPEAAPVPSLAPASTPAETPASAPAPTPTEKPAKPAKSGK